MMTVCFEASLAGQSWYRRFDGLRLIDKKSAGDGWTNFLGHVEAGYGKFCQLDSDFGISVMELEQPGCAYLKARFSF